MGTAAEQQRWIDTARAGSADPAALVPSLTERVTVTQACERLATLADFEPSPALGAALLSLLARPPWRSSSANPFWSLWCFTLLHHVPPPGSLAPWHARIDDDGHLLDVDVDRPTAWFLGSRIAHLHRLLAVDLQRAVQPVPARLDPRPLREALDAGDDEASLRHALEAWARWRDPSLARAIDALSDRTSRPPVPSQDRIEAWHTIADREDPADVPRLLAAVGKSPANSFLDRLARWPMPDPRIAAFATAQLIDPPWALVRPVALVVGAWTVLHASPATVEAMAPHLRHALHLRPLSAAVAARLKAGHASYGSEPERQAVVDGIERRWPTSHPVPGDGHESGLVALVHADPNERSHRLVYADVLLERGDPRGELIHLQCAERRLRRDERARENDLLRAHFASWVGLLTPVLLPPHDRRAPPTWFEGGFLHAAALRPVRRLASLRGDDPAWSTVRELHLSPGSHRLLRSPHLRGLRWLAGLPLEHLRALEGRLPQLTTLGVRDACDEANPTASRNRWAELATRPGLRRLLLRGWSTSSTMDPRPEVLAPWLGSPLARDLERVGLEVELPPGALDHGRSALVAWLGWIEEHLPGVEVALFEGASSRDAVLLVRRDADGRLRHGTFEIPPACPQRDPARLLDAALALLPDGALVSLEVVAARRPRRLDRMRASLARVGVDEVPWRRPAEPDDGR